jgi:outer membrane receptor protein involved in Fe transport
MALATPLPRLTVERASEKMRASMAVYSRRGAPARVPRRRKVLVWAIALCGFTAADPFAEPVSAEESPRGSAESDAEQAPPNVEVLHITGHGAAAIETTVPASITQFDASTIQNLGAQDISDLSRVTPNVNIVQPGATQATFFVRGIGLSDFSANAAGAVTIFQDDVALDPPAIQTGQLFDVYNVEIMRGPQGTGPLRNASGGAIRVQSNLPSGNYSAQLRSSIGRYAADGGKGAHHGLIQDYEGYVEAPIVADWLSSRLAFRLRNSDPYQTNGCGNAPPFNLRTPRPRAGATRTSLDAADVCGERSILMLPIPNPNTGETGRSRIPEGLPSKVDFEDQWAARGILRFQPPNSDLDFVLNGHGSRLDEDQTYGQAIGTGSVNIDGRSRFFGGGTASDPTGSGYEEPDQRAEIDRLCNSTSRCGPRGTPFPTPVVENFERILAEKRPLDRKPYRGDYDRDGKTIRDTWGGYFSGKAQFTSLDVLGLASYDGYHRFRDQDTDFTPDVLFEVVEGDDAWQTFEQLHVGGELDRTPLEWQIGGYYLHEKLDDTNSTVLTIANQPVRIDRDYTQEIDSFGTWLKFSWDFLDDLTADGGVRWNWEKKKFDIHRETFVNNALSTTVNADQDATWEAPTGTIGLTYHFNEDASAFAKYTRGFKAGHFNALSSERVERPPARPEYNDAWEAGLAGSWLGRRLGATISYFYYRYEDYQVFLFRDVANDAPVLEIINAKQAENYGIELEAHIQPLRGWMPHIVEDLLLTVNAGWLHGEFLDFQIRNTLPTGLGDAFPVTIDLSGDRLLNSPEYKLAGSATWTFDLGRFGFIIPRYDFNWTDDTYFGLHNGRGTSVVGFSGAPRLPEFAVGQKAYWLHNLRLAYRTPTGNVEVAAFCRNVEDTVYKNYAFDATNFANVELNFVGTPRTIGVDVIVTF